MFFDRIFVLFVLALLAVPWIIILWNVFKWHTVGEKCFLGICTGLGAGITAFYVLTLLGMFKFSGFWILAIWGVALICFLASHGKLFDNGNTIRDGRRTYFWWILFAVISVAYAVPVFMMDYPSGVDPTFHCLITQKILLGRSLALDMLPFEDIKLNYSQGLHAFMAVLSAISGKPPHIVFQTLHLPMMLLYTVGIFLITQRIFKDRPAAVFAMLAFAFIAQSGNFFNVYFWGGLPTEIAGTLALAFILAALKSRSAWQYIPAVIICGAMVIAHHLTSLIYCLVIGFYILLSMLSRRSFKFDSISRRFFIGGVGAFIAYSWFILPYVMKSSSIGGTSVLRFYEEPMITILRAVKNYGYVLVILGCIGVWSGYGKYSGRPRFRFFLSWFTSILLCFCALDYVYRFGAVLICKENFTAFTPSRFLFFLTCPFSIFAGEGLAYLFRRVVAFLPERQGNKILLTVFCLLAIALGIPVFVRTCNLCSVRPEVLAAAEQIRKDTPPNAFIFDKLNLSLNERCWLSYLTWRQTTMTFVPASENRKKVYNEKLLYLERNLNNPVKIREWLEQRGLEGYMVVPAGERRVKIIKLFRGRNK